MKRKSGAALFAILITIIFVSNNSFAGWTQPKGHAYNQLTYGYYVSTHKYTEIQKDNAGNTYGVGGGKERIEASKFVSKSITYYGEYGLVDTLTVFTSIPWKETVSDDTLRYGNSNGPRGIGDIDFGLRYNLMKNFILGPLSLQGTVKIPEAYEYGYPLSHLSLGDGQYDATVALVYGLGLGKGYAVINGGYKYRFENNKFDPKNFKPSDQIKVSIGGGYSVTSSTSLGLLIDWTKCVGNASVSDEMVRDNYSYGGRSSESDNLLVKDSLGLEQDVLNLSGSLSINLSSNVQAVLSYGVDVGGFWIFETRDAGVGETYNVALVYSF